MHRRGFLLFSLLVLGLVVAGPSGSSTRLFGHPPIDLPASLSDKEFWELSQAMSEEDGAFQSDNLLSNELVFPYIVPELISRTKPGGVYLGVGPEQNFTYMAAIRPGIAIITDIRRGNLHMQLMYKALFELSADRGEFVSRLFSKPRPSTVTTSSTVTELFDAFWEVPTASEAIFNANLAAIQRHLTKTHVIPLSQEDLDGIARVYKTFYWYGPSMNYSASVALTAGGQGRGTNYRDLMVQTDASGQGFSYLGSEEKFAFLKELERKNLVIPVVGNFSGPKALRAVGAYLKSRQATVTAFYLSNVESYLQRAGTWMDFCANVSTFPLDESSVFIRPSGRGRGGGMPLQFITVSGSGVGNARIITPLSSQLTGSNVPPAPGPMGSGLVKISEEVKRCTVPRN
jgi:hypothetical protein